MEKEQSATLRFFGFLRPLLETKGLPHTLEVKVPAGGRSALEVAEELGLPSDAIEAVFRNGVVQNIYDPIYPGDRVAFLPPGTPGPYRVLLGIIRENTERKRRET